LEGQRVSTSLFPLLGINPQWGRAFLPEEDFPGGNHVVILSYGLWQRRFGADPGVIGKQIILSDQGYTVIGVMPPYFQFTGRSDFWTPMAFTPAEIRDRGDYYLNAVARLKPGISLRQAQSDMDTIAARLQAQYPQTNTSIGALVVPLREQLVG